MAKRQQTYEIDLSFTNQNRNLDLQEDNLNVEILRIHTNQKVGIISQVWVYEQQDLCKFFTKYEPFPAFEFSIDQLLNSSNLKLVKNDGKIYFGQIYNRRRQGKGISISKEGKLYQGEFSKNEKNGYGVQVHSNGNLYVGHFLNNKKHGKGKFFWFNLSQKNASKSKSIQYIESYDGQWWGGLPDGFGIHQKVTGDIFTGTFKNGLKHGQGQQYFGNGDYYKGQYVNGLPQGFGQYIWADGSLYKGDLKQGLRNGYGVWQLNKESIQNYKGHYQNDKKAGYGVYQWENGWIYKGNFNDDFRDGFGQLFDGNEIVYRGYWNRGQQNQQANQSPPSKNSLRYSKNFNRSAASKTVDLEGNYSQGRNRIYNRYENEKDYFSKPNMGKSEFTIKKRPQSFTNLQKSANNGPISQRNLLIKKPTKSQATTIGSTINRPIKRSNICSNLYVPYQQGI